MKNMEKKIVIELEIPSKLGELIEKLAKFIGKSPREIVKERCERALHCLPDDMMEYLL